MLITIYQQTICCLVVNQPLWKMMEFVSWDYDIPYMAVGQYLLIPFLVGWTSIYQLFWCSTGVQGFDTLPHMESHNPAMFQSPPISMGIPMVSSTIHGLSSWEWDTVTLRILHWHEWGRKQLRFWPRHADRMQGGDLAMWKPCGLWKPWCFC